MAYVKNKMDRNKQKKSLLQKLHPFSTTLGPYHKVIAMQQVACWSRSMERYSFR